MLSTWLRVTQYPVILSCYVRTVCKHGHCLDNLWSHSSCTLVCKLTNACTFATLKGSPQWEPRIDAHHLVQFILCFCCTLLVVTVYYKDEPLGRRRGRVRVRGGCVFGLILGKCVTSLHASAVSVYTLTYSTCGHACMLV